MAFASVLVNSTTLEALLQTALQRRILDGAGNPLTSTVLTGKQALDVNDVSKKGFATATLAGITIAVANTSTKILTANVNRAYAYIANYSGATLFVQFGATAVANQGISVASGTVYELTKHNLWIGDVFGVFASNNRSLQVFEGTP